MSFFKKASIIFLTLLLCAVMTLSAAAANSKAAVDITDMTVAELQKAVDDGIIDYYTITKLYLDRITAYGAQFGSESGAVITISQTALEEAKAKDEEHKTLESHSDVFGIPIVVKDNIDVKGMPTTAASKEMRDNYPNDDAPVIKTLKEQGAIVIAKANMSYFAICAYESTGSYGSVVNAYDLSASAYGSSSGSCVCVAAKLAPLALGTDTNASLRNPASANGVVAIRPTYGMLSLDGVIPYDYYRDTVGPIAANVYDCATLLGALTGDSGKYTGGLSGTSLAGMKIGIPRELVYSVESKKATIPILKYQNDTTVALMNQVASVFEAQGATVEWLDGLVDDDINYLVQISFSNWTFEPWFNEYIKGTTGKIRKFSQLAAKSSQLDDYTLGKTLDQCKDRLDKNMANAQRVKDRIDSYFAKYGLDAIVYPTMQTTVQKSKSVLSSYYSNAFLLAPTCRYPALSMPMGTDENGLPMGFDIMCQADGEQTIFKIAYAYEQVATKIPATTLAPALYTVPQNVEILKKLYFEELPERTEERSDSVYGKVTEAHDDIAKFFKEYDSCADPDKESLTLIDNYKGAVLEYRQYQDNLRRQHSIMVFIIVFVAIIVLLTVGYVFFTAARRKNRKAKARMNNTRRYRR